MTAQSSVDKTLEIVKDADKFKARITELATAEASMKASTAKAKKRNAALNVEMDEMMTDANAKATLAQMRANAADKAADVAMLPIIEAQAKVDRLNKTIAGREERAKKAAEGVAVDVEVLREREAEFAEKVKNFQNAVKAACDGI